MKVVINSKFGGFRLSEEALALLSHDNDWYEKDDFISQTNRGSKPIHRTDTDLVNLIETKGSVFASADVARLIVVDIPDNCTDWIIDEYEGCEQLYYVVDGLIYIPELASEDREIGNMQRYRKGDLYMTYWKDYDGWHLRPNNETEGESIEYVSEQELDRKILSKESKLDAWKQSAAIIRGVQ